METPRSSGRSIQRATPRFVTEHSPQWVQMSDLGLVRDAASSLQKRIFAIVSRPIPSDVQGKKIRHILLFDNHPDSLGLILDSRVGPDGEETASRRTSIICGSILIAMVIAAMLWPLFW